MIKLHTIVTLAIALFFALLFWIIASGVEWIIFYKNLSFLLLEGPENYLESLLYKVPPHSLFMRISFLLACLTGGLLISVFIKKRLKAEEDLKKVHGELEFRVTERTHELRLKNQQLQNLIEERKLVENALQKSEKHYRLLFDGATNPIAIYNRSAKFVMINRAGATFFNSDPTDMIDKPISKFIPGFQDLTVERISKTLEGNCTNQFEDTIEINGQKITLFSIFQPLPDVVYKEGAVQVFSYDITEHKHAEMALQEANLRQKEITDAANIGLWERDLRTNKVHYSTVWKKQLGYEEDEIGDSLDEWENRVHPDDLVKVMEQDFYNIEHVIGGYQTEVRLRHKDGTYRWILTHGTVRRDEKEHPYLLLGSHIDITERKLAEQKIKASLDEKETLLRELYHRTKNNMQVIISMIYLQSQDIRDANTLSMLDETINRIQSMALVHEKLYQTKELCQIDLKNYFEDLIKLIVDSNQLNGHVAITTDLETLPVNIDTAIPCGLIVNELLSNSFKHGFKDNNVGEIRVYLKRRNLDEVEIRVGDNGVGLPVGFDFRKAKSYGLLSVVALTEHKLRGSIGLDAANGVDFRIQFKLPKHSGTI